MARYQPVLGEALQESSRQALIEAVQRRAPETFERLVDELKREPDSVVGLMIDALTADPALLVRLVRRVGRHEMAFIVKVGDAALVPGGRFRRRWSRSIMCGHGPGAVRGSMSWSITGPCWRTSGS